MAEVRNEEGGRTRCEKEGGGDQDAVDAAVAMLLKLKAQLPSGHEMLASGKKKKNKVKN